MTPVLYDYWRSSASYRTRIALGLSGLEFDAVKIDLSAGEQFETEHMRRNPQGLVPTIEIDGHVFSQSLAIIEYLDETGRYPFLPTEPQQRVRVRTLAYVIAMETHPICNLSVAQHVGEITGDPEHSIGWMVRFMGKGLAAFESLLDDPATGRFCHGDKPTMADVCLLPQIYNARRRDMTTEGLPQISRIVAELEANDAFSAAHPNNFR